jgi:hypothetical protein
MSHNILNEIGIVFDTLGNLVELSEYDLEEGEILESDYEEDQKVRELFLRKQILFNMKNKRKNIDIIGNR